MQTGTHHESSRHQTSSCSDDKGKICESSVDLALQSGICRQLTTLAVASNAEHTGPSDINLLTSQTASLGPGMPLQGIQASQEKKPSLSKVINTLKCAIEVRGGRVNPCFARTARAQHWWSYSSSQSSPWYCVTCYAEAAAGTGYGS